ncbi:MAG TPA: hypothetical protein VFR59_00910, partial [Steroidobacteraceae bacterium]|nr:hypothetical protein [Steroidobacteraceae bacterium]
MSTQRPPPHAASEFDGHDDYLEQFRPPTAQQRLRKFCAALLGIAVGVTVMRWAFNLMDTDPPSVLRIITGPAAFVIGLVAGAFFYGWLQRKTPEG